MQWITYIYVIQASVLYVYIYVYIYKIQASVLYLYYVPIYVYIWYISKEVYIFNNESISLTCALLKEKY